MLQRHSASASFAQRLFALVVASALVVAGMVAAAPAADAAGNREISGTFTIPSSGVESFWAQTVSATLYKDGAWYKNVPLNTSNKTFKVTAVDPGKYTLEFSASFVCDANDSCKSANLISGKYGGGNGTLIDVTAGNKTGLKYAWKTGRTISGTISLGPGANAEWKKSLYATLMIPGPAGCECGDAIPVKANDTTGAYTIRGISPGAYTVVFQGRPRDAITPPVNLITEYYNGSYTWAGATPVNVTSGNASGVNATLEVGRTISGTVSLPGGADAAALKGVEVRVVGDAGAEGWVSVNRTTGAYTVYGLPADNYLVQFRSSNWYDDATSGTAVTPYTNEYYNNSATVAGATKVSVTSGNASAINATLDVGRTISGTVTGGAGTQAAWLQNVWVGAEDANGNYRSAKVNPATGSYTIRGLAAASHVVEFSASQYYDGGVWKDPNFAFEWYDNKRTPGSANPVNVSGGNAANINAVLDLQVGNRDFYTTPDPTVTGTPAVGQTLTAVTGTWGPWTQTFAYQWKRGGNNIAGATAATYKLTQADAGTQITVSVTATRAGFNPATRASSSIAIPTTPFTTAPEPTVTGTLAAGQVLTAVPGTWNPAATFTYQWRRNGTPIGGATASTYTVTQADATNNLTVTVTGSAAGYTPTAKTSVALPVPATPFASAPVPTLAGTVAVGSTLTATVGTWNPAGALAYHWLRNGTPIGGASGTTYTLQVADGGQDITFRVTGSAAGYETTTRTSLPVRPAGQAFTNTPPPTATGMFQVGWTLTAAVSDWTPVAAFSYQWLRDDSPIPGATGATYTLTAADKGKRVGVRITGHRDGYNQEFDTSEDAEVAPGEFTTTPTPTISGGAYLGATLTAKAGAWVPAASGLAYQWLRNGVAISGATKATYKLVAADSGKKISVKVTGSAAGYTSVAKTSAAKSFATFFPKAPAPKITGTAKVGSTVKATTGTWSPKPSSFAYQWYRDGKAISGAKKAQYTLAAADAGKKLTVTVTAKKSGYASTPKTSAAKTVAKGTFTAAPVPKITGTAKVGSTLKVTVGTWKPKPAFTYQWYRSGKVISGATKSSYKLVAADKGKTLTVKVTGTKAGYATKAKTSAKTVKVK